MKIKNPFPPKLLADLVAGLIMIILCLVGTVHFNEGSIIEGHSAEANTASRSRSRAILNNNNNGPGGPWMPASWTGQLDWPSSEADDDDDDGPITACPFHYCTTNGSYYPPPPPPPPAGPSSSTMASAQDTRRERYRCHCDEDCWKRRDCCLDFWRRPKKSSMSSMNKVQLEPEVVLPRLMAAADTYSCQEVNVKWMTSRSAPTTRAYPMVSRCPSTPEVMDAGPDSVWQKQRCESNHKLTSIDDALLHVPLTHGPTGTVYKNVYCAACNGILQNLTFWNTSVRCSSPANVGGRTNHVSTLEDAVAELLSNNSRSPSTALFRSWGINGGKKCQLFTLPPTLTSGFTSEAPLPCLSTSGSLVSHTTNCNTPDPQWTLNGSLSNMAQLVQLNRWLCETIFAPVAIVDVTNTVHRYRNAYCAFYCGRNLGGAKIECFDPGMGERQHGFGTSKFVGSARPLFSFAVLLDADFRFGAQFASNDSAGDGQIVGLRSRCPGQNYVYDAFRGQCRPIYCGAHYYHYEGQCLPRKESGGGGAAAINKRKPSSADAMATGNTSDDTGPPEHKVMNVTENDYRVKPATKMDPVPVVRKLVSSPHYSVVPQSPSCPKIRLDPSEVTIDGNGTLAILESGERFPAGGYELVMWDDNEDFAPDRKSYTSNDSSSSEEDLAAAPPPSSSFAAVLVCVDPISLNYVTKFPGLAFEVLTAVGTTLSLVALALKMAVFVLLPEARRNSVPNRIVFCLSASLFVAQLLFVTGGMLTAALTTTSAKFAACAAAAVLMHYAFLAAFFWMNVLAFDVWRTFSSCQLRTSTSKPSAAVQQQLLLRNGVDKSGHHGHHRQQHRHVAVERRFGIYCLYAWLAPLAVVGVASVMEWGGLTAANGGHLGAALRPRYGEALCWISNRSALLIYFVAPLALLLIANLAFFGLTSWNIRSTSMQTKVAQKAAVRSTSTASHSGGGDCSSPNSPSWSMKPQVRKTLSSVSNYSATSSTSRTTGPPKARATGHHRFNVCLYFKLAVIMGMTWVIGFVAAFADQPALWYCFVAVNTLQGVYIFLSFTPYRKVQRFLRRRLNIDNLTFFQSRHCKLRYSAYDEGLRSHQPLQRSSTRSSQLTTTTSIAGGSTKRASSIRYSLTPPTGNE